MTATEEGGSFQAPSGPPTSRCGTARPRGLAFPSRPTLCRKSLSCRRHVLQVSFTMTLPCRASASIKLFSAVLYLLEPSQHEQP